MVVSIGRPHPGFPGAYQVVARWRGQQVCRRTGISVRAKAQDLDDRSLVITQAIENIAREGLTYIMPGAEPELRYSAARYAWSTPAILYSNRLHETSQRSCKYAESRSGEGSMFTVTNR